MNDPEYRPAEHVVREIMGTLIEDGCDAVVVTWCRTVKNETRVYHASLGNRYAVVGMLSDLVEEMTRIEEESEEEDEESNRD